jgi:sigma-E factor negative regulatory protein RseA
MSDRFSDSDAAREALSALADGEAQPQEVARACGAWKDQPEARATWHAYQLIGDVMRSEDLAETSRGDAFLQSFRERLAQEPVVLAPKAANEVKQVAVAVMAVPVAQALRRRAWAGPTAVAAGFLMAVGALLSSQLIPGGGAGSDPSLASVGRGVPAGRDLSLALDGAQAGNAGFVSVADAMRANSVSVGGASFSQPDQGDAMMRDPQLDQALIAYRASQSGERSFSGQGGLARPVVFDAR